MQKAYKLLAIQEGISNSEAKAMIDAGLVSVGGQRVMLARGLLKESAKFKVTKLAKPVKIFEDENIIAVNKPPFITSQKIAEMFKFPLLNRLDKETSGVIMLYKNDDFQQRAIREFSQNRVKKTYLAVVKGIVCENLTINQPLTTIKTRSGAFAKIDLKNGKSAITHIAPIAVEGKKSLLKVDIETGRTHQIRVHLASSGFGVLGDEKYAKSNSNRLYLHSLRTKIFDYEFYAEPSREFFNQGFNEIDKTILKMV
ncbi:RluA family pseudouridine synthase [Campylobacter sp. CX2-8023-23]|uniref:RNA pseudouridylate synthase n=1 Tax=Campylobacter porcelli TaxID=1660073 RepID=A0ABU7M2E0_9BACT|nr:RluA family pseudouridine synthase [Campylobacter sp. CX2-8023-23]MEE3743876.1 RluA family pseudouridine synthase [Campylobacter sp. CX2-4855-23]